MAIWKPRQMVAGRRLIALETMALRTSSPLLPSAQVNFAARGKKPIPLRHTAD
jgi:hypothetical protein